MPAAAATKEATVRVEVLQISSPEWQRKMNDLLADLFEQSSALPKYSERIHFMVQDSNSIYVSVRSTRSILCTTVAAGQYWSIAGLAEPFPAGCAAAASAQAGSALGRLLELESPELLLKRLADHCAQGPPRGHSPR